MKIQFLGAAGEVTGSRHSVEVMLPGGSRRFMVDCGMFQGGREASNKNLELFPFSPKDLSFVVLTHAHIAHMLGVRRVSITLAAREMKMMGLISYSRGHIQIKDPEALERLANS